MSKGRSRRKKESSFAKYMRRTYKNKLNAIVLLAVGIFSAYEWGDATALLFIAIISIPLFFAKDNWIID